PRKLRAGLLRRGSEMAIFPASDRSRVGTMLRRRAVFSVGDDVRAVAAQSIRSLRLKTDSRTATAHCDCACDWRQRLARGLATGDWFQRLIQDWPLATDASG